MDDSKLKNFPALKNVYESFFANNSDIMYLPELEDVGGHLEVYGTSLYFASILKHIGGVFDL